jgi:hypothetical protein
MSRKGITRRKIRLMGRIRRIMPDTRATQSKFRQTGLFHKLSVRSNKRENAANE